MSHRVMFALVLLQIVSPLAASAPSSGKPIDFNREIRPILSNNCFACHGPDVQARKADLRLDTEEGALAAIVRGKPEASELVERITTDEVSKKMPPAKTGKKLTSAEAALLARWIREGATYQKHWAYVAPKRPDCPDVQNTTLVRNAVDQFILVRLQTEGLKFSPEADRYTLARRVALDLTGLPPTIKEADDFYNDELPAAYERFVDAMLEKPAYGEHAARLWLDLARYADSAGYANDPPRTIWLYRDYVIQSFNANKPFDQFTIEQMAGDLLPKPTEAQLIATAFHRNTLTNSEGGTSRAEFRNAAVVDRVNTTMNVWMGTSMACAQCHSHKFDPISHQEYFRFFAYLNNTADADLADEKPLLSVYTPKQKILRDTWLAEMKKIEQKQLSTNKTVFPETIALSLRTATLKRLLESNKPATVPVMKELTGKNRRKSHVQLRGNYLDLAEEVAPGVPAALHPLPKDATPDRLGLARWLVAPENPLTSRVIANRYWEQFFGHGLVRTSEEFGAQGDTPSHPELLDWLATELVRMKWDTKAFVKMLVMSATYRQSSAVSKNAFERDADNRLLSRGPRLRLTAEMIRDQSLFAGGLLSTRMYGPSVRPVQPELGISAAFGGSIDWKTSEGEDRYRRGLYTVWRRSNPYPSMSTFDAPNRDICMVRRNHSNTPLQALVTLNDSVYIEAAQSLARLTIKEGGATTAEKIRYAFRRCLTRPATDAEVRRLVTLFDDTFANYTKNFAKAKQMATIPLGPAPAGMDVVDLASWTVVGNVLLNLDEALMKR